jgi:hypothetical protein
MDVKNIVEVLNAIELLGVAGKQIAKDGIGIDDLPKALELVKKYQVILDAVNDVELVIDEAKELDSSEAIVLVSKLMSVIKNIKEA